MRLLFAIALVVLALLVAAFVLLVRPAWSAPRCTTYEEKAMQRWQTLCSDGTRATSTWSKTLQQWHTTVTPPPGQPCTGRLHPTTRQCEGRSR